jgi:response regulator RpfG family c-di-GMP phosphodiesterase
VDDEMGNLSALKRFLRREYNVFSATNGEDALAVMEQESIGLVIVDYRMPGMTGAEPPEKTRQEYPNTVRIILTAYGDESLLMEVVNIVNAHGLMAKPWEPEEIESIVGKWITNHSGDQQKLLEGKRRRGLPFWGRRVFGQGEPARQMKDKDKTKEQLIDELVETRQQIAELRREVAEMKKHITS